MNLSSLLIVDDSEVQCLHAVTLCQELLPEAKVDFSYSASGGLDILRDPSTRSDVVIVDLEMPEMDGVQLINCIASESLCSAVIIVSAKPPSLIASVAVMAESQGMKVLGSLQKPLDTAKLLSAFKAFNKACSPDESRVAVDYCITTKDLMKGISKKEFVSFYQPKVRLQDMTVSGVEALARWNHPDYGIVSPYYFIEKMEKKNLIDALTLQLLDLSLEHKQQWNDLGVPLELSINLSPYSLSNTGFTDWVYDHVCAFNILPEQITFEITENALLGDLAKAIQTLARLRLKGFNIAIDDYGTGFANAEQLSRIPATILKLDRSMIAGVDCKPQLEKVLHSTVKLAVDLGMETVAEGVETEAELMIVQGFGVDLIQGYYFGKPMPATEFEKWNLSFAKKCGAIKKMD